MNPSIQPSDKTGIDSKMSAVVVELGGRHGGGAEVGVMEGPEIWGQKSLESLLGRLIAKLGN